MHFSLPDDHVVDLNQNYDRNLEQWTLNDAIVSWDLVNFIINDLTYSAMRNWMTLNPSMHSELFDPILSHHFHFHGKESSFPGDRPTDLPHSQ